MPEVPVTPATVTELSNQWDYLNAAIENLEKHKVTLRAEITASEKSLSDFEEKRLAIETEIAKQKAALEIEKETFKQKKASILLDLENAEKITNKKRAEYQDSIDKALSELERYGELNKKLEAAIAENKALKESLVTSAEALKNKITENNQLESSIMLRHRNKIESMNLRAKDLDAKEKDLELREKKCRENEILIEAERRGIDEMRSKIDQLSDTLERDEKAVAEYKKTLEAREVKIVEKEKELEDLRKRLTDVRNNLIATEEQLVIKEAKMREIIRKKELLEKYPELGDVTIE